jgi:hypothetical protein
MVRFGPLGHRRRREAANANTVPFYTAGRTPMNTRWWGKRTLQIPQGSACDRPSCPHSPSYTLMMIPEWGKRTLQNQHGAIVIMPRAETKLLTEECVWWGATDHASFSYQGRHPDRCLGSIGVAGSMQLIIRFRIIEYCRHMVCFKDDLSMPSRRSSGSSNVSFGTTCIFVTS